MKVIAMIRPTDTREIEVEAPDYETGRELLKGQVPEGWQIVNFRPVR
jgi:hypothetical protein